MIGGVNLYLIDTNIWLEILLEQEKSREAKEFLSKLHPSEIIISEFSLYSLGVILTRLGKNKLFEEFVTDSLIESGIRSISLEAKDFYDLIRNMDDFNLDFDDAYQLTVAEEFNFTIISFDSDFDKTKVGRKTP